MQRLIDYLCPGWKTEHTLAMVVEKRSITGKQWEEDRVLVVQRSRRGRYRCYLITPCGVKEQTPVDLIRGYFPFLFEDEEG